VYDGHEQCWQTAHEHLQNLPDRLHGKAAKTCQKSKEVKASEAKDAEPKFSSRWILRKFDSAPVVVMSPFFLEAFKHIKINSSCQLHHEKYSYLITPHQQGR